MNEVIFLRLFRAFKREVNCADLSVILLFSAGSLLLGILSALIGGGHSLYYHLCMPRFAPPPFILWLIWTVVYLAIGSAAGIAISIDRCRRLSLRHTGIVWWSIGLALNLLWFPLFFGAGSFLLSLLLIPLMIIVALLTVRAFLRRSLLAALVMVLYALWLFFCFFLEVVVILCN